jgi:hypothetical protein
MLALLEAGYNHVVKDVLYFGRASSALMIELFYTT